MKSAWNAWHATLLTHSNVVLLLDLLSADAVVTTGALPLKRFLCLVQVILQAQAG